MPELIEACQTAGVPLLATPTSTGTAIAKLTARLEFHLAERATVHGMLVDLLGLGVLILGESGIGKSECGLELIAAAIGWWPTTSWTSGGAPSRSSTAPAPRARASSWKCAASG